MTSKSELKRKAAMGMEEHHFMNKEDVGIAWDKTHVWFCINGASVFRAKVNPDGTLLVEYHEPT